MRNIVFDLGGVLIDFRPQIFLQKLGYNPKEVEIFTKIVFCGEEWNQYNQSNLNSIETKNELMKNYPEYSNDINNIFNKMDYNYILFENENTSNYLKELKFKGYNIYILSDLSQESYEFNQKFDFFQYVDGGVYSFEINSTKPNENNYKVLLDKYSLTPKETIFIDDRLINVEAANEFGIKGILFTTLDEVKNKISLYL